MTTLLRLGRMRSERALRGLSCRALAPTLNAGGIEMAFWSFVQCPWCGFTGCAAPIGDECPKCGRVLEPESADVNEPTAP